jgi:ATP-dependent DNA helicase RecG
MNTNVYPDKESKVLEFKEILPNKNQLIKTCVAFANGQGGEIIIGIQDTTREILGVSEKIINRVLEETSNSIYDSISPNLIPEVFEKNLNGKTVVIIKIYPGQKPPYFIKQEGNKKGVYLRVGTSTRKASEEYIEELYRNQRRTYFDEEPTDLTLNELNDELVKKIYGKNYTKTNLLADKVLIKDSINPKKKLSSIAGVLFFSESPELIVPEAIVICTQFKGIKGRNIIRSQEITGSIPQIVEKGLRLITAWLETHLEIKLTGQLKGSIPVPAVALREALINALIHRKYFIQGATKIAIFDDRIEIFSPGEFPGLVSLNNLGDGTTFLRNPTLARLARKSKLVEKLGTGIKLIFESCKQMNLKEPEYNDDGDFVKVTLYFEQQLDQRLTEREQIITLGRNMKEIKIKDLVSRLDISRNTATRKLNFLIEEGLFERKGKGPATRYIYIGKQ